MVGGGGVDQPPAFGPAALVAVDEVAAGAAVEAGLQLTLVNVDLAVLPPEHHHHGVGILPAARLKFKHCKYVGQSINYNKYKMTK